MRTKLLYQDDSYINEFEATVLEITNNGVVLDKTTFHDGTGGVQPDSGFLKFREEVYEAYAAHIGGEVVHVLKERPRFGVGDVVLGILDWGKRYRKMRLHTAAHILSAVLYNRY
ncbi:MAG: alanyl-tRNA editing protein, partial [Pyrobaculum sp.]